MPLDPYPILSPLARTLPGALGREVPLVLAFASHVYEIVDGETHAQSGRQALLEAIDRDLDAIAVGNAPALPVCEALTRLVHARSLPLALFRDLVDAAREDLNTPRYASFPELMSHVRGAATPIGRLALHLCGTATARHLALSDGLCCALWLAGMLRDVPRDFARGRLYLPLEDLERYRVTEDEIAARRPTGRWRALMTFEIERARKMLQAGAPLGRILRGRAGFNTRLLVLGAERILKKLHDTPGDVFARRPEIVGRDWPYLVARAVFPSYRP